MSTNTITSEKDLSCHPTAENEFSSVGKWAYYNQQDAAADLYNFQNDEQASITVTIPEIHCSNCVFNIEKMPAKIRGLEQAQVNFSSKAATFVFRKDQLGLGDLLNQLEEAGYPPVLQRNKSQANKKYNRELIIKLGVAGFCFGNIMLLSFPDYLSLKLSDLGLEKNLFAYLNVILSIPVFFYSGNTYLLNAWKNLRNKTSHIDIPIALGMMALFITSLVQIIGDTGVGYLDSLAGLVFFLLIGKWYQNKTYASLDFERDYLDYFPLAVSKLAGEEVELTGIKDIRVGDRILIRNGELIPADARLVEGEAFMDYSFITGESAPKHVRTGEILWAGGRQTGGSMLIELVKDVQGSYLAGLWTKDEFQKEKGGIALILQNISKYFTIGILVMATITAIVWAFIDPSRIPMTVAAVLIVSCPCALALSMPFTSGTAVRLLGKNGFFCKDSSVIGRMFQVDTMVIDKTGTLTTSMMDEPKFIGNALTEDEKKMIYTISSQSTHPLSRSIAAHFKGSKLESREFESHDGKGIEALAGGKMIRMGSASYLGRSDLQVDETSVHLEIDGEYKGVFIFEQEYREGIEKVIAELAASYPLHLVSGDNYQLASELSTYFSSENYKNSPEDKLEFIRRKEEEGGRILMLGDGLNDSGALQASDIGISVAEDIHQFTPASDVILSSKSIGRLHKFLSFATGIKRVIWISLFFSLMYNTIGLYFAMSGLLTPLICAILMPASSVSVVALVTFLTSQYFKRVLS